MIPIPARGRVGAAERPGRTLSHRRDTAACTCIDTVARSRIDAAARTCIDTVARSRIDAAACSSIDAAARSRFSSGLTLYMASGPARGFRPRSAVRAKQRGANIESATISSRCSSTLLHCQQLNSTGLPVATY